MAFNITELMSTIDFYDGIHKPSHFYVEIHPPQWLGDRQVVRDLKFLCEATNLPGIQLQTVSVRPLGYGTPESRPVDTTYSRVRCDFFVDNGSQMLEFFHLWIRNINNSDIDSRSTTNATRLKYYEFAYPKEYEGVVDIYMFTGQGEDMRKVTLNQAFPVEVGDLSLAWEINDSISRIPVTFAYNTWSSELPSGPDAEEVAQEFDSTRNNLEAYAPGTPNLGLTSANTRGPR